MKTETIPKRPAAGRGLFYTRDSGGRHETTPGEYVRWARAEAAKLGVAFDATPAQIEAMIRGGHSARGDLFLDFGVTGNKLSRLGLNAMIRLALSDLGVSHVFIPRRDRFARPDDPTDAIKLENTLRSAGITLVFMDRTAPPLKRGGRRDLGETIVALFDYSAAGEFRRELAQKILLAQVTLARAGFSTGGRPPFGFRRWLVADDGRRVRQLAGGERVQMAGHHVVWLPGPDEELATIRRILGMLETMPASRVAAILTAEEVPPPDSGRHRTDRGVRHRTSGVWHQNTITAIARNPLLLAVTSYGRRSMGDQLRFAPGGPRDLDESDLRDDGQPKIIANPDSDRISRPAAFEALVDRDRHRDLLTELDRRGGRQRGKPRSRSPEQNPLGSRVFDMECGWPMYRQRYLDGFRYSCGRYMQSHGAECHHNHVDGMAATRFILACIRQRLLARGTREKLEARLRSLAERDRHREGEDRSIAAQRVALAESRSRRDRAAENLAFAETPEQRRAIAAIFDQVDREVKAQELQLKETEGHKERSRDPDAEIAAALADFDRLHELAEDVSQLGPIGDLFRQLNARLFLRFEEVQPKKRKLNRIVGGVVTFGASEPPIPLNEGPTGRRTLAADANAPGGRSLGAPQLPSPSTSSARGGNSLGNVSRGDRI